MQFSEVSTHCNFVNSSSVREFSVAVHVGVGCQLPCRLCKFSYCQFIWCLTYNVTTFQNMYTYYWFANWRQFISQITIMLIVSTRNGYINRASTLSRGWYADIVLNDLTEASRMRPTWALCMFRLDMCTASTGPNSDMILPMMTPAMRWGACQITVTVDMGSSGPFDSFTCTDLSSLQ